MPVAHKAPCPFTGSLVVNVCLIAVLGLIEVAFCGRNACYAIVVDSYETIGVIALFLQYCGLVFGICLVVLHDIGRLVFVGCPLSVDGNVASCQFRRPEPVVYINIIAGVIVFYVVAIAYVESPVCVFVIQVVLRGSATKG